MNSMKDVIRSAIDRNKVCKNKKENVPDQEVFLNFSLYLADDGKLRQSFDTLFYAIKTFSNKVTVDQILPIVCKVIDKLRQKDKENNLRNINVFSCPLCCGILYEPLTLSCGHTYCKTCLFKEDPKTCELCQNKIRVEEMLHFHTNVLISTLIDKWWGDEVKGVKLRNQGNEYCKEKHFAEALDLYNEAVKFAPNDHLLLSNRSHVLHALGRFESALIDADEAVLRRPEWAKGYFRQATALLALGKDGDALVSLLICATIENSKRLTSVTNKIAEILLVFMYHLCNQLDSSNSKDFILAKSSLLIDVDMKNLKGKTESKQEEKAIGTKAIVEEKLTLLRKRTLSGSAISVRYLQVEEVPAVRNIMNILTTKMDKIKSNNDGYARVTNGDKVHKSDFECTLCFMCLWEPVTTPCGHTFCRSCLDRCLDHAIHCPLCKTSLKEYLAERKSNITVFVEEAMKSQIPNDYKEREAQHEMELREFAKAGKDLQHEIPIFVATLSIPSIACPLHVFEPRYRLMIRRCMEAGTREFGMCMPSESEENGYANFGTMLEIREIKYTQDGRSIVNTVGSQRFKCISKSVKDGYNTATVEYLKDEHVPVALLDELQQLHKTVYLKACNWFTMIDNSTKRRILSHYGEMPSVENGYWKLLDGPTWIWWLIAILPLEPCIQIRIMKEQSLKARLNLVFHILRCVLQHQRSFSAK